VSDVVQDSITQVAFPHNDHFPSEASQLSANSSIALDVLVEFLAPESGVIGRSRGKTAARMPMPEAAMNKHGSLVTGKGEVGTARKLRIMQTKPQPRPMKVTSNPLLGRRVAAPDGRHHSAARFLVDDVDHHVTSIGNSG
jgi:hypothetical protein